MTNQSEESRLPDIRCIARLDLLRVVSGFGVFGQFAMVAVALKENSES
jgi:hypothetical protein